MSEFPDTPVTPQSVEHTSSSTNISVESGEKTFLGLTFNNWLKLIAIIIVALIIASIVQSFKGWGNSPALNNLASSFGDATSALAWSTSHWYLFVAGFLIAPFVPSAYRWAADKMSGAIKSKYDPATLDMFANAVKYEKQIERSTDESLTPDERAKAAKDAAAAKAAYDGQSDEQREKTDKACEDHGVKPPPAPAKTLPRLLPLRQ